MEDAFRLFVEECDNLQVRTTFQHCYITDPDGRVYNY